VGQDLLPVPNAVVPDDRQTPPRLLRASIASVCFGAENLDVDRQPRDAIQVHLTRDVVDLTWEILQLRRLKAGLGIGRVMDGLGYNERKGCG
jgi:hypothetical protein